MKTKRVGSALAVRVLPGEEILECLRQAAREYGIGSAVITGIGAVGDATFGGFSPTEKRYLKNRYTEPLEICTLSGNLSMSGGEPYVHAHMAASRVDGSVVGGHVLEAVVSLTAEIILLDLGEELCRDASVTDGPRPWVL